MQGNNEQPPTRASSEIVTVLRCASFNAAFIVGAFVTTVQSGELSQKCISGMLFWECGF